MSYAAILGLTKTEARIVAALIDGAPAPLDAARIVSDCLSHAYVDSQTVKVHMVKIRRKLAACGATVTSLIGGYAISEADAARLAGMGQ
ncbi:winged helix-turn-helix domain-containing protein [Rhodoblastus sp.]|uniref:winged helix-turn-helix domain-containing protein n=1 Tax=Rhodoblastus sp. TaxID=1962975 RepID=UPI0026291852|nr:winged helix-turn-helix domain-containing protein [Rhodoblastus sp.]